jgi:hypothetical protein
LLPGGPPGNHLFIAQRVGNEGGNLKGTNTWPAKGLSWYGVSRRLRADITCGAPFSGGKGGQGDTLKGRFPVVIEAPEKAGDGIAGLCADEHRLYVSCPGANEVHIRDGTGDLPLRPLEQRPGRASLANCPGLRRRWKPEGQAGLKERGR